VSTPKRVSLSSIFIRSLGARYSDRLLIIARSIPLAMFYRIVRRRGYFSISHAEMLVRPNITGHRSWHAQSAAVARRSQRRLSRFCMLIHFAACWYLCTNLHARQFILWQRDLLVFIATIYSNPELTFKGGRVGGAYPLVLHASNDSDRGRDLNFPGEAE